MGVWRRQREAERVWEGNREVGRIGTECRTTAEG